MADCVVQVPSADVCGTRPEEPAAQTADMLHTVALHRLLCSHNAYNTATMRSHLNNVWLGDEGAVAGWAVCPATGWRAAMLVGGVWRVSTRLWQSSTEVTWMDEFVALSPPCPLFSGALVPGSVAMILRRFTVHVVTSAWPDPDRSAHLSFHFRLFFHEFSSPPRPLYLTGSPPHAASRPQLTGTRVWTGAVGTRSCMNTWAMDRRRNTGTGGSAAWAGRGEPSEVHVVAMLQVNSGSQSSRARRDGGESSTAEAMPPAACRLSPCTAAQRPLSEVCLLACCPCGCCSPLSVGAVCRCTVGTGILRGLSQVSRPVGGSQAL